MAKILSLGEQQRLAFARLLLNSPRFAVLDEATSALDIDTEKRLYNLLRERELSLISVDGSTRNKNIQVRPFFEKTHSKDNVGSEQET